MSMPAGWYDDGSGRQRWWDGERWTDQFAAGAAATQTPSQSLNGPQVTASSARIVPVLGFVGLGLALIGTVLACIPATFVVGVVVLIAGFVVSLVGVFKKNAAKWPSIVGMVVSIVGGAIGTVVTLVIVAASLAGPIVSSTPTDGPTSTTSEQPSAPPVTDDPSTQSPDSRPSPEVIAEQLSELATSAGLNNYGDMPDFWPCMGEQMFNSSVPDESLWLVIQGEDPLDADRDVAAQAIKDAVKTCDPEGNGAWG